MATYKPVSQPELVKKIRVLLNEWVDDIAAAADFKKVYRECVKTAKDEYEGKIESGSDTDDAEEAAEAAFFQDLQYELDKLFKHVFENLN